MKICYIEQVAFNLLFQLLYLYIERAIEMLRSKGVEIPEAYLQQISPLGWEHITLTGDYVWNLEQDGTVNQLRPLRVKNVSGI